MMAGDPGYLASHPLRPCDSCFAVITDDPSGLCEDCQTGVISQRRASLTADQRMAITGLLIDQGVAFSRAGRAAVVAEAIPGWAYAGDLGALSQQQAADLLEHLEQRRLSQEARKL
jgi:hypothetical protein